MSLHKNNNNQGVFLELLVAARNTLKQNRMIERELPIVNAELLIKKVDRAEREEFISYTVRLASNKKFCQKINAIHFTKVQGISLLFTTEM